MSLENQLVTCLETTVRENLEYVVIVIAVVAAAAAV